MIAAFIRSAAKQLGRLALRSDKVDVGERIANLGPSPFPAQSVRYELQKFSIDRVDAFVLN